MVTQTLQSGYKQTEVGVVPEDWEVKPIGSEIDLLTGFPFSSDKYASTGIKLLRGSNIKRGKTDWSEEITEYWDKVTFELRPYVLNEGDIVVAMDGSLVGRSFARLSKKDVPALLLQRVARIRSNKIDMGYLKEYVCSDYFTKYCDSVKTVTAIPHISPQDIRKFIIPLPPTKEEQSAIAEVLSDTDALIESLNKLIEKRKNIKQGAAQELLTGKKRLPGFNEEWEMKKLGEECELITKGTTPTSIGKDFKKTGINFIKIEALDENGNILKDNITFIDSETNRLLKRSILRENDILISIAGALGRVAIVTKDILPANINQALSISRLKKDTKINARYLFHFLSSFKIKKHIELVSVQGAQANLSLENISDLPIEYPSFPEQTAIAQVLADMDSEIEEVEQERDKYKKLKIGMMQQLLTGRIRLKWKN
jgi:type I restriction enzyme S subunit